MVKARENFPSPFCRVVSAGGGPPSGSTRAGNKVSNKKADKITFSNYRLVSQWDGRSAKLWHHLRKAFSRVIKACLFTTMATILKEHSSLAASVPSYTSSPLYNIALPSFLAPGSQSFSWFYTSLAVVGGLLVLEQSVYRYKKRHLPGAAWTIPIIGKFADSLKPTFDGYIKQWDSGELSAISVFNMYALVPIARYSQH